MELQITRGTHATVMFSSPTSTVIVDPGAFGYPDEVNTADAVLVTHDHFDHVDLPSLTTSLATNEKLAVYSPTPLELGEHSDRVTVVSEGDRFTVGDIDVEVVGKYQATASIDDDAIPNVGYLIAGTVLHPGDQRQEITGVDTVITALAAPWQNNPQLEEHLRRVTPHRVIGTHDATLSDLGREFAQMTLEKIAKSYGGEAITMNTGDTITIETVKD